VPLEVSDKELESFFFLFAVSWRTSACLFLDFVFLTGTKVQGGSGAGCRSCSFTSVVSSPAGELRLEETAVLEARVGCSRSWLLDDNSFGPNVGVRTASSSLVSGSSVVVSALLAWTGGLLDGELELEEAAVLKARVGCSGA
jgi:hypothetical protein